MPEPTVAPLVLALGVALLGAGVALGTAFLVVGIAVLAVGLGLWVANLLPGRGHAHEPLAEPGQRPRPVVGVPGRVEQLLPGMPGYRVQLPLKVHPISAGVKGGILGGLVLVVLALVHNLISGHGLWYPANLLAGMVLPGIQKMTQAELEQFHLPFLIAAIGIHAIMSVVFGLIYGVLLPTLPDIPKPFVWGGLLMPMFWTAVSFAMLGVVNPLQYKRMDWPSFIFAQFIFGVVAATVVTRARRLRAVYAGILGGIVGGVLMPVPAALWSLANGYGLWYPANLLAGMIHPGLDTLTTQQLQQFDAGLTVFGLVIHVVMSLVFGVVYGLLLPRLPRVPGPMAWGGTLMPLLWTGASYGLMGVVNPVLEERVEWPWFIPAQFIFGVVASIVVVRSEEIPVPPVGPGPASEVTR